MFPSHFQYNNLRRQAKLPPVDAADYYRARIRNRSLQGQIVTSVKTTENPIEEGIIDDYV